jgi:hypothetical protein
MPARRRLQKLNNADCMLQDFWNFIGNNAEQLISLLAFVVAIGSFWVQRKHNRLSVKPHLITFTDNEEDKKRVVVWLKNNGIGPALIKSFEFRLDGKTKSDGSPYKLDEILNKLLKDIMCRRKRTQLGADYAMPANECLALVDIELMSSESLSLADVKKRFECVDLIVQYESFYGTPFVLDTSTDTSSKMACPVSSGGS